MSHIKLTDAQDNILKLESKYSIGTHSNFQALQKIARS